MRYWYIIRVLLAIIGLSCLALAARADVIHTVKFSTDPIVLLWPEMDAQSVKQVSADNRPSVPVVTEHLLPVETSAAGTVLLPRSGEPIRFRVASNAPFRIHTGTHTACVDITLQSLGPLARDPDLRLNAQALYFATKNRTANQAGAPRDQAATFEAHWSCETNSGDAPLVVALISDNSL